MTTQQARARLRRFRQGSVLAVALTALLLTVSGGAEEAVAQPEQALEERAEVTDGGGASEGETSDAAAEDPEASIDEATGTVRDLLRGFYGMLPKLAIAVAILLVAWMLAALARAVIHHALGGWERKEAVSALTRIVLFVLALGVAMSVIAGDARALVGSVGLVGLALSWALQTPIESFTGWLINSFRGYYRVGDRIAVGDVFGDVYRIDVLTTTVWEAGGPGGSVAGAQPTGAMITFPNWEVLRSNVINYTRDFPFVWDEVTVGVSNDSDLPYTLEVLEAVAKRVVGPAMAAPAQRYEQLLERARLAFDVPTEPKVFLHAAESWTDFTIRYLVPARERRRWSSELVLATSVETAKPEHRDRIRTGYPRRTVEVSGGLPTRVLDP